MKNKKIVSLAALLIASISAAQAQIQITEVDPAGSNSTSGYKADWFELYNAGSSAVDITGWTMDDNSDSFSLSVPLRNVTSIAAGQAVVFIEAAADGSTDSTVDANFITAWFGATAPAGLVIGNYGGSGVGLSQTTDAVNIFDSLGNAVTGVTFGATTFGATLDNTAGLSGTISTVSETGVNGAFESATGLEVGSPGIVATPEPSTLALAGLGLMGMLGLRRIQIRQA